MSDCNCSRGACDDPWDGGCAGVGEVAQRRYSDPSRPGLPDERGMQWWACDPYPHWYRWVNGEVETPPLEIDEWLTTRLKHEAVTANHPEPAGGPAGDDERRSA